MKIITKDINELKDSKILYEKDLPPFGYFILLMVCILMVAVVLWGITNNKPFIVKGTGIVESPSKNYVMSPITGVISKVQASEGDYVEKGDVLFQIKSLDVEIQNDQLEAQKKIYEEQITQYEKLAKSIKDNTNYFDKSNEGESLYYSQFEEYRSKINQQIVDTKALKSYGYSKSQIRLEKKKNEQKKNELYYAALREVETSKNQIQVELETIDAQLSASKKGEENFYKVKANAAGTVHFLNEVKKGMVVQAATSIASISTENDKYLIRVEITASDRSRIKAGDKAEVEISGLQRNVYGVIKGKVKEISSDSTITTKGSGNFTVFIVPQKNYLISKSGDKVSLSPGLQCEARVIYNQITYAEYVLDALGVKE